MFFKQIDNYQIFPNKLTNSNISLLSTTNCFLFNLETNKKWQFEVRLNYYKLYSSTICDFPRLSN